MYQDDTYSYTMFERFFFEKNLQGDIVAVYNEFGEKLGSYYYDAWGNHTVVTESGNNSFEDEIVNNYNPFRYRGYYYDIETGFYYLQSRYYNPEWGRFLNADVYVSTGQGLLGNNMYAYCNNNPVSNIDPKGTLVISIGATLFALTGITAIGLFGAKKVAQNPPDSSSVAKIIEQRIKRIQMGIFIIGAIGGAIADAIEGDAKEEADSTDNPNTKEDSAIYYGADAYGGSWKYVTGPMTLDQAIAWTESVVIQDKYGKNVTWGVYTYKEDDAWLYISSIGIAFKEKTIPCGCYPHFHLMGRKFGKYEHFHAWYGEIVK